MYVKGYKKSEAEKEKLRQSHLGAKNPMYGKKFSVETRAKMSKARMGMKRPKNSEMIRKQKESLKEFYQTEDGSKLKDKLREVNEGTSWHKGFHHTFSLEVRAKMGETQKLKWQDPVEREKRIDAIMKAGRQVPNYKELLLLSYLNEVMPDGWEFVGHGKLKIGEKMKVPDFVCKLIPNLLAEHYGKGFHTPDQVEPRIKYFEQYGYKTLIVWQYELKDKEKVMQRIRDFISK